MSYYILRFVASGRTGNVEALEDARVFNDARQANQYIEQHSTEEVAGDWTSYTEEHLKGKLTGVTDYRWDADFGQVRMIMCPSELLGELVADQTQDLPDITAGDIEYLNRLHQQKSSTNESSMNQDTRKKLKSVVQEVLSEMINAKAKKSLSDKKTEKMKPAKLPQNNTQMKSGDKTITSTAAPKEKAEGKKLPVVKKPATPTVSKESLKESVIRMIREELEEMARTPMTVNNGVVSGAGSKFIVQDPASSTGYSLKGHPKFPDGTPAAAPKGPYVPKGQVGMGRPASEENVNGSIDVKVDGKSLGSFDLNAKLPSGKPDMTPMQKRLRQFIYNEPDMAAYEIDQSVAAKFEQLSDLDLDGKLTSSNRTVNLRVANGKIVA